jgi:Domain of unknown function (DUF4157)
MKAAVRVKPARERPGDVRLPAVVVRALDTPGEPLGTEVRGEMKQRLGHDFGHVRIHTDARAAAAARALDSLAFTSGAHIAFAEGRYRPHSPEGQRLLAHELVHTLQQRAPAQAVPLQPGGADPAISLQVSPSAVALADPLEAEAAAVADRLAAGKDVPAGAVSVDAPAARGRIARQAREAIARAPREDSLEDIQAVADDVARLLLFDPQDRFGRVRRRLAPLPSATREAVAASVRGRVTGPTADRLDAILVELRPPGAGPPPLPEPVERPAPTVESAAPETEQPSPIEALGRLWRAVVERLRPSVERSPVEAPEERATGTAATAPAEPTDAAAAPIEPPTTAAAAAETEQPPEHIAAAAVAGLAARDAVPAPTKAEPEAAVTPVAPGAAAKDAEPARRPVGTEETSESGEDVDPRVDEAVKAGPEDAEDEAAADEAAEAPTTVESPNVAERAGGAAPPTAAESPAGPEPPAATQPMAAAVPQADADLAADAQPPDVGAADANLAGSTAMPDLAPADADPGAGAPPSDEAQQVAAETASDAMGEPDRETAEMAAQETAEPEPEPGEPGTAPAEGASSVDLEDPEQPGAEPAAEPTIGTVDLGPLAEVQPDEEDAATEDGGAGAGAPIEDPPVAEIPAVGGGEPEASIDMVASLPPTAAAVALGGVRAATSRSVAEQRGELADAPPQLERPTGAPTRAEAAAEAPAPPAPARAPAKIERAPAGASFPTPPPAPLPPAPAPPIAAVPGLHVGGETTPMTEADFAAIRDSVKSLPTTDPALNVTAGAPPTLNLQGDADPAHADEQRAELDKATIAARTDGAADAAAPMCEAAVLPTVPPETLRAAIVRPPPPAVGTAVESSGAPDPAVDAVIGERHPGELGSAAATARAGMDTERRKQAQATEIAGAESRANIEKEVAENAARQRTARDDLRHDVREQREQWTAAQKDLVDTSQTDADKARTKLTTDVATEREKGTTAADEHIAEGNRAATTAREDAERKAREARSQGEAEPTGFLGWVASEAKAFFESIKTAISNAFEAARKAVKQAIKTAQKLAAEAIDAARKAVVKAIKAAGDALIEIGDRVLAGFPRLRTTFRGAIRETVGAAERVVNALADGLKAVVQAYLDLYAKALDGILGLLETGLLAVVDGYAATVQGMIKAAQFVLNGLGDLLQVAKDIASGPRAWLRNLGAAIADGVRNHLWTALKNAVSEWFDAKVDAILGLGKMVWNVLAKGGITFAAVAKFAFAALKKVIPVALVRLLITKLIGLLVPAAAAVMAIIEGIQAAWAAAGSVIGAISKFIVFLKAVKGGNAGLQFAEALAAAAVAVIEFISSWLLQRLLKSAAKVGKVIKGVASKIAAKLKRLIQALKRGVKKLTRRVKVWMRKTGRRFKKLKERFFGKSKKGKKDKRQRQQERLDRAVAAIKPPLEAMLRKGTSTLLLWGRLRWWQLRWWLSSLKASSSGEIAARINPARLLVRSQRIKMGKELEKILADAEKRYLDKYSEELVRDPELSKPLNDAMVALAARRKNLPELSRKDQILLLRALQAGEVYAPRLGRWRGVRFGPENLRVVNVLSTAQMFVGLGSNSDYPALVSAIEEAGRTHGLSQAQMAGLIRARTPEEFGALSRAAIAGMSASQARRTSGMLRNVGFLTQALEPARGPGLMAATSLASTVTTSPRQYMGSHGQFAPITPEGAASTLAAERTGRHLAPAEAEKHRALRATRRSRIAQIFLHLRYLVQRGELQGLKGDEAAALRNVAQSFDRWTKARLNVLRPAALEKAVERLTVDLVAWMERFYK